MVFIIVTCVDDDGDKDCDYNDDDGGYDNDDKAGMMRMRM